MKVRPRAAVAPGRQEAGGELLVVRGVTAARGSRQVLTRIDLTVHAGELIALVGPNGAGKSSLVAAIAGDLAISEGAIVVDGRPAADWSPIELALRRAVLPQQFAVAFPFVAREVVRMGRAPWRDLASRDDDERRVDAALAAADAADLADRRITALSGGERARIALARLLAQETQLLLLDEPTAALDLGHQEIVMQVLRERVAAGDGVVVVLHDLSLAAAHADRMVVVDDGRVVADGPPATVATPELLEAVYRAPIEVIAHPVTGAPMVLPRRW
ncbi:MAG TPA: heme ABC transporter ATP-binding protein [Ilumatobacter sp.]|nr:heme ABC transporter ATP-binding protein [Ilumatobacter sp.]